jgi:hypothetical protein
MGRRSPQGEPSVVLADGVREVPAAGHQEQRVAGAGVTDRAAERP